MLASFLLLKEGSNNSKCLVRFAEHNIPPLFLSDPLLAVCSPGSLNRQPYVNLAAARFTTAAGRKIPDFVAGGDVV